VAFALVLMTTALPKVTRLVYFLLLLWAIPFPLYSNPTIWCLSRDRNLQFHRVSQELDDDWKRKSVRGSRMKQAGQEPGLDRPVTCEIQVQGWLDESWSDWFDGIAVAPQVSAEGTTITKLTGTVVDQAALHGLLRKLYNLGLPLLSVTCINCYPSSVSPS